MSAFVFDKEALQKLRRDILENPEKYEKLLLEESEHDPFYDLTDHGMIKYEWDLRSDNR